MFWGGGPELTAALYNAADTHDVPVHYETTAVSLITKGGAVCGVIAEHDGEAREIQADAVVLACGGFQSNAEMRTRYLGPGYDLAKVRGTQHNNGGGITMTTHQADAYCDCSKRGPSAAVETS